MLKEDETYGQECSETIMEVVIEHLGAVQFEIKARAHTIVSDQPAESGGYDQGMTPPELLLASLGSCAAFYAGPYLRKHNLASEGTRVRVLAEKEKNPARLENLRIEVDVPVPLKRCPSERHRECGASLFDSQHTAAPAKDRLCDSKSDFGLAIACGTNARDVQDLRPPWRCAAILSSSEGHVPRLSGG
jgi:uncharacterized OsmC-like protein